MDLVVVAANKTLQGPARGSDLQGAELGQGTTFSFLLLPQRRPALGGRDHVIKKKSRIWAGGPGLRTVFKDV